MARHLLLVEDEENDVILFQRAVDRSGLKLSMSVVQDGQDAIDYLSGVGPYADRQRYPLPSLVLLDLNLPRVKGLEVLQWVRQHPRLRTLIIVMTSSQSESDLEQAYCLGANSYLVKPNDNQELIALLQALYSYWFKFNRAPNISEFVRVA